MPRTSSKGKGNDQPMSGGNNSQRSTNGSEPNNNNNNIRASLSANNNSSNNNPHHQRGSPGGRFGHFPKYTKPKIGPAFQCAVPKFIPPNNNNNNNNTTGDSDDANGDSSGTTTSASRTSNNNTRGGRGGYRGRGGRGRGGRGGGGRGGRGGGGSNKLSSGSSSLITDMGGRQDVNLDMLGARPEEMANAAAEQFVGTVGKRTIPRGGLCVHRPMAWQRSSSGSNSDVAATATTTSTSESNIGALDRHDDYLLYTRNIFLQTPQPRGEMTIDQIWDDAAQKKFGSVTLTSSNNLTGKKKGRKRKADENNDEDGSKSPTPHDVDGGSDGMDVKPSALAEPLLNQPQKRKPTMMPMCGLEDDERMLSFLQANHGGDMEKAKFSIMVNSDRGHAVQKRRQLKKKRKEAKREAYADATSFSSESWRWRVNQPKSTMLGDYRSNTEPSYHYFDSKSIAENKLLSTEFPWRIQRFGDGGSSSDETMATKFRNRSISIDWSTEEIEKARNIWRSLLAYTTDVLSKFSGAGKSNGESKPSLSDLLDLVGKAYALPTPEEAFGRRDPSARTMSENMNAIVDAIDTGRGCVAKILKNLKDDGEGIELEDLKKSIKEIEQSCPVLLSELDTVKKQIAEATLWEETMDSNVNRGAHSDISDDDAADGDAITEKKCTLEKVERLLRKGRNLTMRPRSLVRLQNRVERAHILRRRIVVWNEARSQEDPQNIKFIATLIKEANKVDLAFPELLTLTGVHKKAEEWMERASIAARTTISFEELETLVSTGESLPLNVSDVLEKLQKRLKQAQEWIMCVNEIVPSSEDNLVWLKRFRNALEDSDSTTQLTNLLSQGSRIPVDMGCMKLLQIEIDARNWSMKARPWIPENLESSDETGVPQKRGKIDDVEEHLDRASSLRDRLWFSAEEKSQWVLDGESELSRMLEMAEEWFDKYDDVISYDNRSKKKGKLQLPISKLHAIAEEVNKIPLNLGNPATRMNRIYSQAETWVNSYHTLVKRCGIECSYVPPGASSQEPIELLTIDDLDEAVSDADSDIPFDLSEVVEMRSILEKSQDWMERATAIAPSDDAPKKAGWKEKHSLDEIAALLAEAPAILVDIASDVERLRTVRETVESWRIVARQNLRDIISAFNEFKNNRFAVSGGSTVTVQNHNSETKPGSEPPATNHESHTVGVSTEMPVADSTMIGVQSKTALVLVANFVKSVKSMTIETPEGNISEELNEAISWFNRALKMMESAEEVYDKRNFTKLDKTIQSGRKLIKFSRMKEIAEDATLIYDLRESWAAVARDDIERLLELQTKRNKFLEWCEHADEIISSTDKKILVSTLTELEQQSSGYPSLSEVVSRVRKRANDAQEWLKVAKELLNSGEKIPIEDAKHVVSAADKLNINCPEYKTIRTALKATRSWLLKVKKISGGNEGQTSALSVKELINEHATFLVTADEESAKLQESMCGYCICRQPYEGFMIGCDTCEEWYHGPCVGITESQAAKVEKYVCVRCNTVKVYNENVSTIAAIVRKWSSATGLVKARSADDQRYGRKTRHADKEYGKHKEALDKYKVEMKFLQQRINRPQADATNAQLGQGKTVGLTKEETSLLEKIQKAQSSADTIAKRIEGYRAELVERKNREAAENSKSAQMKKWCRMIKKEVLAPATKEQADSSRPKSELMSPPMEKTKTYAETLGINDILDVDTVLNSFKTLCWCLAVLETLAKKSKVEELRHLISHSEGSYFKLPESKCVRMIRSMSSRAQIWQAKAQKALRGVAGGTDKFDLASLNEMMVSSRHIPLTMPEQSRIWSTIQDGGSRYCICGGPSDGSFMLGCDNCDKWFHGSCMKVSKEVGEALTKWVCPSCTTKVPQNVLEGIKAEQEAIVKNQKNNATKPAQEVKPFEDISPHAPRRESLWPPLGLRGSQKAIEAFGKEGDSDTEDFVAPPVNRYHLVVAAQNGTGARTAVSNSNSQLRPVPATSSTSTAKRNGIVASNNPKPKPKPAPVPASVNQSLPVPVTSLKINAIATASSLPPKKKVIGNQNGTFAQGKSNNELPIASTATTAAPVVQVAGGQARQSAFTASMKLVSQIKNSLPFTKSITSAIPSSNDLPAVANADASITNGQHPPASGTTNNQEAGNSALKSSATATTGTVLPKPSITGEKVSEQTHQTSEAVPMDVDKS